MSTRLLAIQSGVNWCFHAFLTQRKLCYIRFYRFHKVHRTYNTAQRYRFLKREFSTCRHTGLKIVLIFGLNRYEPTRLISFVVTHVLTSKLFKILEHFHNGSIWIYLFIYLYTSHQLPKRVKSFIQKRMYSIEFQ